METKIGVTQKSITEFNRYLQPDFVSITRAGVSYNKLFAFEQYIDDKFEIQFETNEDYEKWLVDFVYFLIPTDFVQYISHYSGWVKEVLLDLRFDIVCEQTEVVVEGNNIVMPTSVVSVIPCSVTYFNAEGLAILESVIGSWNNQNPNKTINIPYTFESYTDLISFRNEQL